MAATAKGGMCGIGAPNRSLFKGKDRAKVRPFNSFHENRKAPFPGLL